MRWVLDLAAPPGAPAPVLDADQQQVVDHRLGPLLVLAGPGTGKTTTIVEAICARLSDPHDPVRPEAVLGLTFGRKAATELRERVVARLGGGVVPTIATFHSFAYALLRQTESPEGYLAAPRLMSGAEEDVRIRELLRGAVDDGTIQWPDDLAGALPTLGLANEVRAVLSRARELGLRDADLRRIGVASGRPAWAAVGELARQEQDVMGFENVLDYTELIYQAWLRAGDPEVASVLRSRYRAIYVDEYQDTDRLQVELLRTLVGAHTTLVAVGDPDQAIYGFRGADVRGLLRFPRTFPTASGDPAPVAVLRQTRRFGPHLRSAASAVLGSRLPVGLPAERAKAHRDPQCASREAGFDEVSICTYSDAGAQAAHVAREIRLAHVERNVPWRELAVLVRSGNQLPALQRGLAVAGVPVVVAADEIPLRAEPAVATLLAALDLAARPQAATAAQVIDVLTGPLVALTASDVRRLGRALRRQARQAGESAPSSDVLIRDLVLNGLSSPPEALAPSDLAPDEWAPDDPVLRTVTRTNALLRELHQRLVDGAGPPDVLWTLWSGGSSPHGWPNRLRQAALDGSRSAHHDLDAVMALFDTAERMTGRYPGFLGVRMFLDVLNDQQIPAEPVADRGTQIDAVRVLTAHRAKGLEWQEVWVVGLEEGVWPDVRPRGSTLRAEELTAFGVGAGPRPAELLEEERRLLYVACTRARTRLHLSAIDESDEGGERPSRFIDDLREAGFAVTQVPGRPRHPVTLTGLVAELRAMAVDTRAPAALRDGARERLAVLGAQRDAEGRPLAPLADPAVWWGRLPLTEGPRPVRDPDLPLALSGSGLDDLLACPLHWFLEKEVHAETTRGSATSFGSVVHAVADFVAKGDVDGTLEAMDAQVDRIWGELRFEARWQSAAERAEARAALSRFLTYHQRQDRQLVDTETSVEATVMVPLAGGGTDTVWLRGYIDRVERDAQGRLVAIDLKNMRRGVPDKEIPEHGQLGVYQLILREGGEPSSHAPVDVGGAALVQLRVPATSGAADPQVQMQEALAGEQPTWVELKLGEAAAILRSEDFSASLGKSCRFCQYATSCPLKSEGDQVVS